jgi:hypothetical protein
MITQQQSIASATADRAVAELHQQGFAVVPGLLTQHDHREASQHLDDLTDSGQGHDTGGCFGYGIHPLVARQPLLARFFAHPTVLAVCRIWLGDDPVITHTGARIVDPRHAAIGGRIGWHTHGFARDPQGWPNDPSRAGTRGDRLLFGWYLDGSDAASGALIGVPRRWNDPVAAPVADRAAVTWPGEAVVAAPPASLVFFTIDLWHCAASGTGGARRRLMGAHVMGRGNPRPHPEDHDHADPRLDVLPPDLLRSFRR